MINNLRRKLAEVLNDAAHKGLSQMDVNSPLAEEIKKFDIEEVLKSDIEKICCHVSFLEMIRIMGLMSQLKSSNIKQGAQKAELREIAQQIIDRTQQNEGKLKIPMSCREILFNL